MALKIFASGETRNRGKAPFSTLTLCPLRTTRRTPVLSHIGVAVRCAQEEAVLLAFSHLPRHAIVALKIFASGET